MTREELRAHAEALVADWPDLTEAQLDRLAVLLRTGSRSATHPNPTRSTP